MIGKRVSTIDCCIAALIAVAVIPFIVSSSIYPAYSTETSQSVQTAMPATDLCSDYITKKEYDMAIEECSKLIQSGKMDNATYFINRGRAYLNKRQYDLAVADFNKAIELNTKSDRAYYDRGFIYYEKGQYDLAIADYTKAIELNPKAGNALGLAQEKAGQIDDAMENFRLYLLAAPTAKDTQAVKNRIYGLEYKVEQKDKAISMSNECNKLFKAGRTEEVIAACKEAVRLDPKYYLAHYNLGVTLCDRFGVARRQEACPEAIPEFEEAIRLNGYYFNAYINLGNCYNNVKDYRKAISIIEEGMRKCTFGVFLNDNHSTGFAYAQLGVSYDRLDEYEKALNYYKKAKELGADDPVLDGNINGLRRRLGR